VALIDIKGVHGIRPKIDSKLLKINESQTADNCNLSSGAIKPWRSPKNISQLAKSGDIKSIYYFNDSLWFHWTEDVDVIRGPVSGDTTERTYFTGVADGMRVTNYSLADTGGNNEFPEDSYLVGVPAPINPPTAALNGTHSSPSDTAYAYTFVNIWGEESAPSPASNVIAADFTTGSVDLTNMSQDFTGDYATVSKWRIYRIATGTNGAEYLFVTEITPNASSPQYNDTILSSDLGEVLPTIGWALPPTNLRGLVMMGNGIMAGFDGSDLYFSEPFIPYAWPIKYSLTSDYEVVGIGAYGNSLVVATKHYPYIITGMHPDSMSMEKIAHKQPCVSKRGIVSVVGGVIYPTPTCLFYIGDSGAVDITKNHYTREEWNALTPNSCFSSFYDNKYIGHMPALSKSICFDSVTEELSTFSQQMSALWSDPLEDKLYFVGQEDNKLYEFNAGGQKTVFEFKSKKFSMKNKLLMTAGKIIGDFSAQLTDAEQAALEDEQAAVIAANAASIAAGEVYGALNATTINEVEVNGDKLLPVPRLPETSDFIFQLLGDGELIFESVISSDKPFRLPGNNRYTDYEIIIFGQYPIQRVLLASSIRELSHG